MGKNSRKSKGPQVDQRIQPATGKEPRVGVVMDSHAMPVWRVSHMDWDGPWCPSACAAAGAREIMIRLAKFEGMTWTQIQSGAGSHFVHPDDTIKPARQRLAHLKRDDWGDQLFSLRMSGKERLWGFLRGGVFHVLWWDPDHQVCPSIKKHT